MLNEIGRSGIGFAVTRGSLRKLRGAISREAITMIRTIAAATTLTLTLSVLPAYAADNGVAAAIAARNARVLRQLR